MTAASALSWKAKAEADVQMQLSGEARPEGQWDADCRGVPAQAWLTWGPGKHGPGWTNIWAKSMN